MKIYFASWLTDRSLGTSLTKKKANKRLLSFYFLFEQKIEPSQLIKYVETGRCDLRKIKT